MLGAEHDPGLVKGASGEQSRVEVLDGALSAEGQVLLQRPRRSSRRQAGPAVGRARSGRQQRHGGDDWLLSGLRGGGDGGQRGDQLQIFISPQSTPTQPVILARVEVKVSYLVRAGAI